MKTPTLGRWLAAACVAAASLQALPAAAYSSVVIFGDSLSDSGNIALLIGTDPGQVVTDNGYIPGAPYASGTFSNGAVWADSFAAGLGLDLSPSLAGGANFAYGGAETNGFGLPPSLRRQVGSYLDAGAANAADTLFVIAGGGNNARSTLEALATSSRPQLTVALAARRYANDVGLMVDQLQAAGAQNIVVWNTPDIGLTPAVVAAGGSASAAGSAIAANMNLALSARLAGEQGVLTFDTFGLLNSIAADPGAFGLVNASDACGAVSGCDPSSYLFWDGIHPTSGGHQIIAGQMLSLVSPTAPVPEPAPAALLLAGLGVLAWRRRSALARAAA